ncbi:hypothetical protein FNH05_02030 [Amycolatopsis rhizosphaerae]|uniref:Uncharacterized protein n=1 Tax=Amycolatopsis rhizosphaerae TaxID=2053003 RepID=A0A558DLC3_9PSEU|nr:hypothetical protein [Amycolatopsis rhizosphaerae]TVT61803.1 hypothetical protein FNH05_02030 [Amycolatopsis rhizosphaerae]
MGQGCWTRWTRSISLADLEEPLGRWFAAFLFRDGIAAADADADADAATLVGAVAGLPIAIAALMARPSRWTCWTTCWTRCHPTCPQKMLSASCGLRPTPTCRGTAATGRQ